jgi:hypothetical protein
LILSAQMGEAVLSIRGGAPATPTYPPERVGPEAQRAARGTLRGQIARLETELGAAVVSSFAMRGRGEAARPAASGSGPARPLDLGELEIVRDELATRLRAAQMANASLAAAQRERRAELERMLLEPGRHRFRRISCEELGDPGCGVWQVRPRLGLIGMLAGWWQVKLSSGCPLPGRP